MLHLLNLLMLLLDQLEHVLRALLVLPQSLGVCVGLGLLLLESLLQGILLLMEDEVVPLGGLGSFLALEHLVLELKCLLPEPSHLRA